MTRELAVHHYCRSRTARQRLSPRCYHAVFTIHINHSQCHCKDEDTPRGQIVPEDVMRGKRLAVVRRAPHAPRCSRTSLLSCCKRLTQKFHHTQKNSRTRPRDLAHIFLNASIWPRLRLAGPLVTTVPYFLVHCVVSSPRCGQFGRQE